MNILAKLNNLNVLSYSIIVGLVISVLSLSIAYTLTIFGEVTGLYSYASEELDVVNLGWFSIIIVAPLLETVILLFLISLSSLFTTDERKVLIVAVLFSMLHAFSSWITVFAVLPLFLLSVKSYFLFKPKHHVQGFTAVYLIHLINNSVVISLEQIGFFNLI